MTEVMNHAHVEKGMRAERHALGAEVERGGDEVERAEQLADAEDRDGERPRGSGPCPAPVRRPCPRR